VKCNFRRKTAVLRFEPHLGGLEKTYDVHLKAHWKARSDFLHWTLFV